MLHFYKNLGGEICIHIGLWRFYSIIWFRRWRGG